MPTVRSFLGDKGIASLQAKGLSDEEIISLAKNYYKQNKTLIQEAKEQEEIASKAIVEANRLKNKQTMQLWEDEVDPNLIKKFKSGEISFEDAKERGKNLSSISKAAKILSNRELEQNKAWDAAGRFSTATLASIAKPIRGVIKAYENSLGDGKNEFADSLKDFIEADKNYSKRWSKANPDEWNVAATLGDLAGGAIASSAAFINPTTAAARIAAAGATGAIDGALANYGEDESALKGALYGGLGGAALGGVLEGGIRAVNKLMPKNEALAEEILKAKENIEPKNEAKAAPQSAEAQNVVHQTPKPPAQTLKIEAVKSNQQIPTNSPTAPRVITKDDLVPQNFNLFDKATLKSAVAQQAKNEAQKIIKQASDESIIAYSDSAKFANKAIKENPNLSPQAITELINAKFKATEAEEAFTKLINDGELVESRLSPMRAIHALQKEIELNTKSADEIYESFKNAGYSDINAALFAKAYESRDANIVKEAFVKKVSTSLNEAADDMVENILKKGGENNEFGLSGSDERVFRQAPINEKRINGELDTSDLRAREEPKGGFDNSEQGAIKTGVKEEVPNTGSAALGGGELRRLPNEYEKLAGQLSDDGSSQSFFRDNSDSVVAQKNVKSFKERVKGIETYQAINAVDENILKDSGFNDAKSFVNRFFIADEVKDISGKAKNEVIGIRNLDELRNLLKATEKREAANIKARGNLNFALELANEAKNGEEVLKQALSEAKEPVSLFKSASSNELMDSADDIFHPLVSKFDNETDPIKKMAIKNQFNYEKLLKRQEGLNDEIARLKQDLEAAKQTGESSKISKARDKYDEKVFEAKLAKRNLEDMKLKYQKADGSFGSIVGVC